MLKGLINFLSLLVSYGKPFLKLSIKKRQIPHALTPFIPNNQLNHSEDNPQSVLNNFIIQGAFFKASIFQRGGHLALKNNSLSYIRIPKSANTSLSLAFLEKNYSNFPSNNLTDAEINLLADLNLVYKVHNQSELNFFTVVRNPLSRVVSVYKNFFQQPQTDFIYKSYLFGVLDKEISFDEFLNRISKIPDFLKDQHIKPQHQFLNYYTKKNYEIKIFKLEEDQIRYFLHGHGIDFPHRNQSSFYDLSSYYTSNNLNLAYNIYRRDIELFGYQKEYHELKTWVLNT